MNTPNGRVFQVVPWGHLRDKLKDLHRRAKDKGQGTRVLSAVKRIIARLRTEALEFGEPRFTLHNLKLEVRIGALEPLAVLYAVHSERRIVFIRDFRSLPGSNF